VRRCSATSARGLVLGEDASGQDVREAKQPQARVLARTLAIAAECEVLTLDRAMLADRLAKLVNTVERASAIERGIRSAR